MKIMVFLHGTVIMHQTALGVPREERVAQVQRREASVWDFATYVPIGEAARKLRTWAAQDAEILYLSAHRLSVGIEKDRAVLRRHGFPEAPIYYRASPSATYAAIAESVLPDVLIEDDCESIGGAAEMTYPNLKEEIQAWVRPIIVREFEGIDHLPDDVAALPGFSPTNIQNNV